MAIHYQRKKHNDFFLPHSIYYQTIWTIKGYFLHKEKMEDVILATPDHDGMPKGNNISDPTAAKAIKVQNSARLVRIIDEEKANIQEEYRSGVWRNIMYGERFPEDAHRNTYSYHKHRFIYSVAVRLGYYQ